MRHFSPIELQSAGHSNFAHRRRIAARDLRKRTRPQHMVVWSQSMSLIVDETGKGCETSRQLETDMLFKMFTAVQISAPHTCARREHAGMRTLQDALGPPVEVARRSCSDSSAVASRDGKGACTGTASHSRLFASGVHRLFDAMATGKDDCIPLHLQPPWRHATYHSNQRRPAVADA